MRNLWQAVKKEPVLTALGLFLGVFFALFAIPWVTREQLIWLGDTVVDPLVVLLVICSFRYRVGETGHVEERRFWNFLALAFGFWLVVPALGLYWSEPSHTAATYILTDTLYLSFYLAIVVALETRPHRPSGWSTADPSMRLDSLGAVVLVFALLVYAVLVPSRINAAEYDSFVPALVTFLSLDLLILVRVLYFRKLCRSRRWERLYGSLAAGMAFIAVNDGRELLAYATKTEIPRGNLWDVLWYPPLVAFAVLGWQGLRAGQEKRREGEPTVDAGSGPVRTSAVTLVVYAFVLPLLHFVWYGLGLLDPASREVRELVVLVGLLVLAALSVLHHRCLQKRNAILQRELVTAQEHLNQSRRMEAVGRLAGGVAHDFNNLLMIIRGYAELLQDTAANEPSHRATQQILAATDRASALTRQLLAFSRKQVIRPRSLDLGAILHETQGFLHRLMGAHIHLTVQAPEGLWAVRADRSQIEQVLMNLAANSRDAMPQGGTLTIAAGNVVLDARSAGAVGLNQAGEYVLLRLADTGTGMDAETRSRIFEPFFTTKEKGKGTGLGLATVYAIVQQCHGAVQVESQPGAGTTFCLYFPRTTLPLSQDETPQLAQPTPAQGTVLLVEDEQHVRDLARQFLEQGGFTVLEADSADEALRMVTNQPAQAIDVLVTDLIMPGTSGRELADRLRTARPETRVLFISGHTDDEVLLQGVSESGLAFLQKPFTRAALVGKMQEIFPAKIS